MGGGESLRGEARQRHRPPLHQPKPAAIVEVHTAQREVTALARIDRRRAHRILARKRLHALHLRLTHQRGMQIVHRAHVHHRIGVLAHRQLHTCRLPKLRRVHKPPRYRERLRARQPRNINQHQREQ